METAGSVLMGGSGVVKRKRRVEGAVWKGGIEEDMKKKKVKKKEEETGKEEKAEKERSTDGEEEGEGTGRGGRRRLHSKARRKRKEEEDERRGVKRIRKWGKGESKMDTRISRNTGKGRIKGDIGGNIR